MKRRKKIFPLTGPSSKQPILNLAEHLKALELGLLSNTTRKNAARVSSVLADSFREFGSSGCVYTKADVVCNVARRSTSILVASEL